MVLIFCKKILGILGGPPPPQILGILGVPPPPRFSPKRFEEGMTTILGPRLAGSCTGRAQFGMAPNSKWLPIRNVSEITRDHSLMKIGESIGAWARTPVTQKILGPRSHRKGPLKRGFGPSEGLEIIWCEKVGLNMLGGPKS